MKLKFQDSFYDIFDHNKYPSSEKWDQKSVLRTKSWGYKQRTAKTKCEPLKSSTGDGDKDISCSRRERKCDDDFDYENEWCRVVKKKSSPSKLTDEKLSVAFKNLFGKLQKSKGKDT